MTRSPDGGPDEKAAKHVLYIVLDFLTLFPQQNKPFDNILDEIGFLWELNGSYETHFCASPMSFVFWRMFIGITK